MSSREIMYAKKGIAVRESYGFRDPVVKNVVDGIGDCVVVLTNLARLAGTSIEECIDIAYDEIKDRTGKMNNGTFKKD